MVKQTAAKVYAPAFEILNVHGAVQHASFEPWEQPFVGEALKINIEANRELNL